MKKKLTAVLLVLCMTCGVMACGAPKEEKGSSVTVGDKEKDLAEESQKEKISLVTIGGEEYDLSGDFQDVVGAMVKDGVRVTSNNWRLYDEDGKDAGGSSALEDGYDIMALETDQTKKFAPEKMEKLLNERGRFIRRDFYLYDMEAEEIASALGISSVKDVDKSIDKETFLEIRGGNSAYINGTRGYVGVFVNGEALDFSDYEDELEDLKNYKVKGKEGLIRECFPDMYAVSMGVMCGDIFRTCRTYDELKETMDERDLSLESELLVWFALADAYERLEAEKADSFTFVSFGVSDEQGTVNMSYHRFCFDKTWSEEKS